MSIKESFEIAGMIIIISGGFVLGVGGSCVLLAFLAKSLGLS